ARRPRLDGVAARERTEGQGTGGTVEGRRRGDPRQAQSEIEGRQGLLGAATATRTLARQPVAQGLPVAGPGPYQGPGSAKTDRGVRSAAADRVALPGTAGPRRRPGAAWRRAARPGPETAPAGRAGGPRSARRGRPRGTAARLQRAG